MDEITLVREMGEETPLPSYDRLGAARRQLLSEIAPPRPRLRWAALVAVAGAAAVAAVTVPAALSPAPTPAPSSAVEQPQQQQPRMTPVAAFLNEAAIAAEQEPDVIPRGDQYLYLRFVEWDGSLNETWLSIDGRHDGKGRDQDGKIGVIPGCKAAGCEPTVHYRADMPTDPAAMAVWIRDYTRKASGADHLDAVGKFIGVLPTQLWMRPVQRSAFYRAIGLIDGMRLVEGAKDSRGREGIGVAWASPGSTEERVLWIFDPKSHRLIGTKESSLDEVALVDRIGQKG